MVNVIADAMDPEEWDVIVEAAFGNNEPVSNYGSYDDIYKMIVTSVNKLTRCGNCYNRLKKDNWKDCAKELNTRPLTDVVITHIPKFMYNRDMLKEYVCKD